MIYADNAATTQLAPEALARMMPYLQVEYGNASQPYSFSRTAKSALKEARETIAACINANPEEIYFTSGGSEGNNLILKGLLKPGHHFITTAFEHHSIISTCKQLEEKGVKVTYLDVDSEGRISLEDLEEAITKDTVLVLIMQVNNEIGVIQDIEADRKSVV